MAKMILLIHINKHLRIFFLMSQPLKLYCKCTVNVTQYHLREGFNFILFFPLFYYFVLQASQITFICPMIFNYFPLDTQVRLYTNISRDDFLHKTVQVCKFQVGSYSYNMEKMIFNVSQLGYAHTSRYNIRHQNEKYFTFEMLKSLYDLNQGQRSR